jgi:hypothetical protein
MRHARLQHDVTLVPAPLKQLRNHAVCGIRPARDVNEDPTAIIAGYAFQFGRV